jgi:CubicO group peptidase (beta-lactamase class C family)
VVDAQGLNTPSWGLFITTRDLAKIGQLYLNNGIWKGKRIVSDEWVKTSVTEHSRWEIMDLAYGYLWWIINEKDGIFAGLGDGGNALYVNRKKNMTVAITSLMNNDVNNRIEFIEKYIETLV